MHSETYTSYTMLLGPLLGLAVFFFPLLGSISSIFGQVIFPPRFCRAITCILIELAAVASVILCWNAINGAPSFDHELTSWITTADLSVHWSIFIDPLSSVMLSVITVVSAMVHIYSLGYMHDDDDFTTFIGLLSLFTFFMIVLVTGDNLLQLFCGWEGVGLASYLLIGFWYKRDTANAAAIKAFVTNRVGDVGLVLGMCFIYSWCGSLRFEDIMAIAMHVPDYQVLFWICLCLFIGAMGKSAQLGLHVWLPDAMEGPTPVSALIHAATMVTAGVFLLARFSPLFEMAPMIRDLVAYIGIGTALFAGLVAMTQNDIKRVIAYSTCSQLGYMVAACGLSLYNLAIFHLFTHAFFKALLFLGAGSVIHAFHHEQDMTKLGGAARLIPRTYVLMWIGALGLTGVPFFAGFYSKDAILLSMWADDHAAGAICFIIGLFSASLTTIYTCRMLFMTFHGPAKAPAEVIEHVHESPLSMQLPMWFLAIGTALAGYLFAPLMTSHEFWQNSLIAANPHHSEIPETIHALPLVNIGVSFMIAILFFIYRPEYLDIVKAKCKDFYQWSRNAGYFDRFYDRALVKPYRLLTKFAYQKVDVDGIDYYGPGALSKAFYSAFERLHRWQSGLLNDYLTVMCIALIAIIALSIGLWIHGY